MSEKRARKNAKRLRRQAKNYKRKREPRSKALSAQSGEINQVELKRYIEYLQGQLLTEGTESFFDPKIVKQWTKNNRYLLIERAKIYSPDNAEELADSMAKAIESFQPKTRFDSPFLQYIFTPLLQKITSEATEIGFVLKRSVTVENSTELSITPYSRPSADHHLIFIGASTSSFCNMWAKIYTSLFAELSANPNITKNSTENDYKAAVRKNFFAIRTAARLSAYYAVFSNVLQFENFQEPNASAVAGLRLEILVSMESFVLAHEYAHCKFEEDAPELQNTTDSESKKKLEYLCDFMGMRLSRGLCDKNKSWLGSAGAGAFLFFNAVTISEKVGKLLKRPSTNSNDHPLSEERVRLLYDWCLENTASSEQREATKSYLRSLFWVCDALNEVIVEIFTKYTQERPEASK